MALPRNLIRLLESLRRAWPAGRTVQALAMELDIQPWRVAELIGRCEHLQIPLDQAGTALRLDPAGTPLLGELIEWGLVGTPRIGRSIIVFAQTSSTNDIAWQAARRRGSDGLVVLAETQTAGRGRQGRTWLDQPGACLLFSLLLLDVPQPEGSANRLVMAASVALAEAIRDAVGVSAVIRWPNDLYIGGRKLAGILLESRAGGGLAASQTATVPVADVVLGVGINCNADPARFAGPLRRTATSLSAEMGLPVRQGGEAAGGEMADLGISAGGDSIASLVDRTALMRAVLSRLEHWLVGQADSPDQLHHEYLAWMDHQARRVRIHHGRETLEATIRDVDPIMGLIVELPAGGVCHFSPAQVSLDWLGGTE